MINLSFNPFDCEFHQLNARNLQTLKTVSEGWYVEYKSQAVPHRSIAKSLAAFANHYGGWIFYGVQQSNDGGHVAQAFPGVDQGSAYKLIEDLRNAAKDIVTPSPYYEYKKLDGPCEEIGLPDQKSIIVVAVPTGPDAPYVHNDGRIYRRIADSSDPKHETDRFVLDSLWHRRQSIRVDLAEFLDSSLVLSEGEDNISYLDLYLLPDPLRTANQIVNLSFQEFVKFMSEPIEGLFPVSFDNFFTMANGMIARHVHSSDPYKLNLTWRYYSTGFSVISIPLNSCHLGEVEEFLNDYNQKDSFLKLLKQGRYYYNYVLDLNPLYILLMAILGQNRRLLEISGLKGSYYAKGILRNVWRRVPFFDTGLFIEFIQRCGLPVIQFETEYTPPGNEFETLVKLRDIDLIQKDLSPKGLQDSPNPILEAIVDDFIKVFPPIMNGLGLPWYAVYDDNESEEKSINSLWEAGQRGGRVNVLS